MRCAAPSTRESRQHGWRDDLASMPIQIDRLKRDREGNPASPMVQRAVRALRLVELTGGNLSLVAALQARLDRAGESEGSLRPLGELRPDEWLDLAYTHGPPDGSAMDSAAYAEALAAAVEEQRPDLSA
jgi:hypothetical protein